VYYYHPGIPRGVLLPHSPCFEGKRRVKPLIFLFRGEKEAKTGIFSLFQGEKEANTGIILPVSRGKRG